MTGNPGSVEDCILRSQDLAYSKVNTTITYLGCDLVKNKRTVPVFEDSLADVRGDPAPRAVVLWRRHSFSISVQV
jgi:hypothetical protein